MSIGTRIREARKSVKMTQAQLAKKSGIVQSTLSELETGASDGTSFVASIAAALGVNALWLQTGKGLADPDGGAITEEVRQAEMILAFKDETSLLDFYRRTDDRGRFEIAKLAARECARVNGK